VENSTPKKQGAKPLAFSKTQMPGKLPHLRMRKLAYYEGCLIIIESGYGILLRPFKRDFIGET